MLHAGPDTMLCVQPDLLGCVFTAERLCKMSNRGVVSARFPPGNSMVRPPLPHSQAASLIIPPGTLQSVEVAAEVDFAALAARTAGYSGDDITGICRDAAMNSLRRQIRGKSQAELVAMRDRVAHEPVNMDDFLQARSAGTVDVTVNSSAVHECPHNVYEIIFCT